MTSSVGTTLFTPGAIANPYPEFARLRPQSPVYIDDGAATRYAQHGLWCLLRYDDVYGALQDHETFSSDQGNRDGGAGQMPLVLLNDDPPRHTRFRRLVNKAFTPKRIAELEPWIASIADELLDDMGSGRIEAVDSYTMPLPVKAIAKLLGIPGEDYRTFKLWTDATLASNATMPPEQRMQYIQEMMAYFGKIAAERRAHGAEDLVTALVEAEFDGEGLADWEVLGFCLLLLIAGNETTTNLMGNLIGYLSLHPELWQQLREDRSLVPPVIEEMLRYESPVQVLFRRTTRDVELQGVTIPSGARCGMFYGAANRDPEEWGNADEFDPTRDLHSHVGFGHGVHYCLGSPLARAEARTTLNRWLDRFVAIEPAEPAVRQTAAAIVLGYRTIPLVVTPA